VGGRRKVVSQSSSAPSLVSLRAYSRHRKVTLAAVQKAIESGRLSASLVRKRGFPTKIRSVDEADREWDANTNAVKALPSAMLKVVNQATPPPPPATSGPGPEAPLDEPTLSLNDAMALEKKWKAKSAELDYRQSVGQLVNAAQVESKLVETITRCRTKLLGVPGKVKTAIPSLTRPQIVTIENLIREALEDLTVPEATEGAA
jgi:hypothetical protein